MMKFLPKTLSLSLAALLLLTIIVYSGLNKPFDLRFTTQLQSMIPQVFDFPLSIFSLLGTVEIASVVLLALLLLSKNLNKLVMLSLYGLTVAFELIGKSIITQNAPPLSILRTYRFFEVPSGAISGHFFSYPSGHSARTAFVSSLLLYMIWENRKLKNEWKYILSFAVVLFDFTMFFSRVYLGEHWMTDVIGGAILGFSLFLSGFFLSRRFSSN